MDHRTRFAAPVSRALVSLSCLALFSLFLLAFPVPALAQVPIAPDFETLITAASFQRDFASDATLEDHACPADAAACDAVNSILQPRLSGANSHLYAPSMAEASSDDLWGFAVAVSDFDNNGIEDVAIGIPGRDVGVSPKAGAVWVYYNRGGFSRERHSAYWTQDTSDMESNALDEESFGRALASGDFNGDGFNDLAVGVSWDVLPGGVRGGAVHILYGTRTGLTANGSQYWHQEVPGVGGAAAEGDQFGASIATGDFNGDGFDDIAIGVPADDVQGIADTGSVNVLYGSDLGITISNQYHFGQNSGGIPDDLESGDLFGSALAAGDFDGDGYDDLIVTVAGEDIGGEDDAGMFHAVYGGANGLDGVGSHVFYVDGEFVKGSSNPGDNFGSALAVGDFDGDGFDDLAVGTPNADWGADRENSGMVHVFFGSLSRLSGTLSRYLVGDGVRVHTDHLEGEQMGGALAAGDFNGDGIDDLVIASPGEYLGTTPFAGEVAVLYGAPGTNIDNRGPSPTDYQFFNQDTAGVADEVEPEDRFGTALAAGDLNGDGRDDLLVGVPWEDANIFTNVGSVHAIFSEIFNEVRLPMIMDR